MTVLINSSMKRFQESGVDEGAQVHFLLQYEKGIDLGKEDKSGHCSSHKRGKQQTLFTLGCMQKKDDMSRIVAEYWEVLTELKRGTSIKTNIYQLTRAGT